MARMTLTTEGNFPTVVGGVTRWCDVLLRGLPEFDWTVLALGVEPVPADLRRVPILQPAFDAHRGGHRPTGELVDRLARALFAEVPDPDLLRAALLESHNVAASIASGGPALIRAVQQAIFDVLPAADAPDGPVGRDEVLELAVEFLDEVLMVAGTSLPPTDLHLVACAGRAVIPAVIDQALRATPMVVVEHGLYVHEAHLRTEDPDVDPAVRLLVRRSAANLAALAYSCAAVVVGVSEANCRRSVSFGANPERTLAIVNGVDVPSRAPGPASNRVVGTVGRIDPFKGVDVLVEAARQVVEQVPTARFVHIGPADDPLSQYEAQCRALVSRSGLGDRFSFLGSHPDPPRLLPDLEVFVLPSRSEGLPFALLEAMAAARPIVASSVGGIPEALGDAGVLVPANDPSALAAGVISLLSDRDRATALGRLAHRVTADRYEVSHMLDGYRSLLRSVLTFEAATA